MVGRGVSSLQPDRPSAAHELGLGALQVWQALSEKAGRGHGEETVALLFTDLVEFSSWALEAGDTATVELLRGVGVVLETSVVERRGTIVKRLGDGLMAAFGDPRAAVDAALDAVDGVAELEVGGYRPRMRAGIHVGKPRPLGGDYFGVDVNIAARVGAAAKGQQLLVSDPAVELIDPDGLKIGRPKRLSAPGAPQGFRVREVSRQ
jgi:class 3 adenylate cyclase